jgi:hypothetical protein
MKHRRFPIPFLFCFALCLTTANPLFAESLLDVVEAAQITIQKKYPNRDSIARKMALEELEEIARSGDSDEEIVKAVLEKFPEASAELLAKSDRNSNGVPDEWEKTFKVSDIYSSPDSDEDSDGFNLLEEYKAGSDPVDPLSHPKYITRIYVSNVIRRRFSGLELVSVDSLLPDKRDWTVMFSVNRNGRKRTEFTGIDGGTFTSGEVSFRVVDIEIDEKKQEPVVYLQRPGKNERIPCRLRQPVYEPVPQVRFLNSLNGRTFVCPVGGKFRLGTKKAGEENYRVVSMDPDAKTAMVESVGEKPEMIVIPAVPNGLPAVKPAPAKPAASAKAPAQPAAKAAEKTPMTLSLYAKQAEVNILARPPVFAGLAAPFKAQTQASAPSASKSAAQPTARPSAANQASKSAAQPTTKSAGNPAVMKNPAFSRSGIPAKSSTSSAGKSAKKSTKKSTKKSGRK